MANTWPALRAVLPSNEIKYKSISYTDLIPGYCNPIVAMDFIPGIEPTAEWFPCYKWVSSGEKMQI